MEIATLDQMHHYDSLRAANRIVGDFVEMRDQIRSIAEGFAVLDFVQGYVATDLPAATALDIVDVVRGDDAHRESGPNELVLYWLENYRRAYSQMIMRVLEGDVDSAVL
jgi:hypothetical protein